MLLTSQDKTSEAEKHFIPTVSPGKYFSVKQTIDPLPPQGTSLDIEQLPNIRPTPIPTYPNTTNNEFYHEPLS